MTVVGQIQTINYIGKYYSIKPDIGERIWVKKSMSSQGEIIELEEKEILQFDRKYTSIMHLQIPSIFLETYKWLENVKQFGNSVDVENFYIMRAIKDYNRANPSNIVKADIGYYVSDYVGEKALREYSNVYKNYDKILKNFIDKSIAN